MLKKMNNSRILVIIINYNCSQDTILCLKSLEKTEYENFAVYIIDNYSEENSYEILESYVKNLDSSKIKLFRSEKNLGFAGGVNLGIKYALSENFEFVLLLNPDTMVEPDFLDKILDTTNKSDDIGIVGCKILFSDRERIFYAGGKISYFFNIGHNLNYGKKNRDSIKGEVDATFVTGCMMLIRTDLIRDIGFFDEDYFMYIEDVDFCFRALRAGWKIKVNLDAVVYHKESGSSSKTLATYWGARNRLRFIFKNLRGFEFIKAIILHAISKPFSYLKIGQSEIIKHDIKGVMDFFTDKK